MEAKPHQNSPSAIVAQAQEDPAAGASSSSSPQINLSTSSTDSLPSQSHSRTASQTAQNQTTQTQAAQSDESMERQIKRLQRPKLGSRKSSGSIIIPRESPVVELKHEEYDDDDARAMSPRRTSDEIDRMGVDAREALEQ